MAIRVILCGSLPCKNRKSSQFPLLRDDQPRSRTYPNGELQTITDEIGIESTFTYLSDGSHFIHFLDTPYGRSTFTTGRAASGNTRWLELKDPEGGLERVEYRRNNGRDLLHRIDCAKCRWFGDYELQS